LVADSRAVVLLADDDPLIVATLGHVLKSAGYDVLEAYDSGAALAACIEFRPTLAIIDYGLPGTNGVELARLIAERTSVPVMFLSAYNDEAIVRSAIAAGAMTYLVKPIDTLQVLPAVTAAVQRANELRALREQTNQLSTALQTGRTVSLATGLVMARFQISQQEALERMRRHARSRRTRLEAFANELLKANDEAGKLYESLNQGPGSGSPTGNRGNDA
jgi:response regulator NasT